MTTGRDDVDLVGSVGSLWNDVDGDDAEVDDFDGITNGFWN